MSDLDLAVIGNCQLNALIDRKGVVVWCCWPVPDGNPLFCSLLTKEGGDATNGMFAIDLIDQVSIEQRYERNTAVVETIMRDKQDGTIRILDFCPRFRRHGRLFRPSVLMRLIQPMGGRPRIRLRVKPLFSYGAEQPQCSVGSHHVSYGGEGGHVRVTTDASVSALMEDQTFTLDRPITLMLGPDETVEDPMEDLGRQWLEHTRAYWLDWVRTLAIPFEWQEQVIRAAITLKLCTYEDTGAVMAALTTSIPEAAGTQRNWDYRYCWLRDSLFTVQALNRLGCDPHDGRLPALHQQHRRAIGGRCAAAAVRDHRQPADPRRSSSPRSTVTAAWDRPCTATGAYGQRQHDVYGAVILAASQCFYDARLVSPGDVHLFEQLELLGRQAAALFDQPDAGPWEFRGHVQVHTFSAVMCWAACDRLARIARPGAAGARGIWQDLAGSMREQILRQAWNPARGVLAGRFGGDEIDATALLLPELGFLPPADERFRSTLLAIERELRVGDLISVTGMPMTFGSPDNAFTICSFWYVNALAAVGRVDEGREIFERLLQRRNGLGMFSEGYRPGQRRALGQLPQAYSMVGIIIPSCG